VIIIQHTDQHILIIQHNVNRASDAQLTDEVEVKGFIGLLCLAGALRNNQHSLQEL
jgi:hypothetical protein